MAIDPRRPAYEARRLSELLRALAVKRRLHAHDGSTRQQIEELQRHRFAAVFEFARRCSPFYADLYRSLPSGSVPRLTGLPVVTKAQLMERLDEWVTNPRLRLADLQRHLTEFEGPDGYYRHRYRVLTTGGSSGRKAVFVFAGREWSVLQAQLLHFSAVIGTAPRLGRRIRAATVAAGHPLHVTYRGAVSVDVGAERILRLEATTPVPQLVAALQDFQPEWLHAYPSIAAMLAQEQLDGRLNISPRVVSTSSELRTPEMTEQIADAWGSRPFDMYGMTEAGIFGLECERHRLHAMDDDFIFEVVDDDNQPVPAGEPGRKLLITNLFMRTQPLIRYEISDMVAVSSESCPCRRPFPVLKSVEGRSDDILHLPAPGEGEVAIHPMHFRSPLAAHRDVRQYQVVQRKDDILVRVVATESADPDDVKRRIRKALHDELAAAGAQPPPLTIETVPAIERDPETMSKLKLVVAARDE